MDARSDRTPKGEHVKTNVCAIAECDAVVARRKLCGKHRMRMRRYGSPEPRKTEPGVALDELLGWMGSRDRDAGCWEWPYSITPHGYGQVRYNGTLWKTHRLVALLDGRDPQGMYACHRCDNRKCVNPAHIFLGTNQDNMADMVAKGRSPRGETKSKLSEADVFTVRRMIANGVRQQRIAEHFGVSHSTIHDINAGRTWAWLEDAS